jgi:hypothetical protein
VRNELFAAFELYSEVTKAGRELLKKNGHPDAKRAFPQFQSYIRQALSFYRGAENLHYRSSPLNYYYSFMNFAKAAIFGHDPTFQDINLRHGLTPGQAQGSLRRHFLTVHPQGVFPAFYRHATKKGISGGTKLSLAALLSYTGDVRYEYGQFNLGPSRVHLGRIAFIQDQTQANAHALLAVYRQGITRPLAATINKLSYFESVTVPPTNCRTVFEIDAETLPGVTFFETKKVFACTPAGLPIGAITQAVLKALGNSWSLHPFDDQYDFELNATLTAKKIAMNEALAIYLIFFYLGSLVRYRPWVLEKMLSTQEVWMIERFVKSAPITFLRHIRNMLDDQYFAYSTR